MPNDALLQFVRGTAPASTTQLWSELTLAGLREPPADLPQKLPHLANALLGLALAGKVIERDGEWHVAVESVKEPVRQASLFG